MSPCVSRELSKCHNFVLTTFCFFCSYIWIFIKSSMWPQHPVSPTHPKVAVALQTAQESFPLRVTADGGVGLRRRQSAFRTQNLKAMGLRSEQGEKQEPKGLKKRKEKVYFLFNSHYCPSNKKQILNQFHSQLVSFVLRMGTRRQREATPPVGAEVLLL